MKLENDAKIFPLYIWTHSSPGRYRRPQWRTSEGESVACCPRRSLCSRTPSGDTFPLGPLPWGWEVKVRVAQ